MIDGQPKKTGERINVAVVGYGYWGPNLVRNFLDNPRTALSWICELNQERRTLAGHRAPNANLTDDFNEVLGKDVDLVAIATPVGTHFDLALRAIAAHKHVLIEKPLCSSLEEADELAKAAKSAGVRVFVDHTFVFTPAVRKMAEIVNSPEFGRALYYDSVRVNLGLFQSDISVLWDLAPHDLSILDYIFGGMMPERVTCIGAAHFGGVENIAYLTLSYATGFIAHINLNWLAPVKIRQVVVGGSERLLLYDDVNPVEKIRVFDKSVFINGLTGNKKHEQLIEYRIGDMFAPMVPSTEALKIEVDHLLACLLDGEEPISGLASGRNIVAVLEAAERSLRTQGVPQELGPAKVP